MLLTDLFSHPDQRREERDCRYGHVLGPGLAPGVVAEWQREHPDLPLPDDLGGLLTRIDGMHLWADLEAGRGYQGILPLAEWTVVRETHWGHAVSPPGDAHLVISYHDNGALFLALDTRSGTYLRYDTEVLDAPEPVAASVAELLELWWSECAPFDPRREAAGG